MTTRGIWAKCSAWRLEEKKKRRKVRVVMVLKASVWDWVRELEKRNLPSDQPVQVSTDIFFKFIF